MEQYTTLYCWEKIKWADYLENGGSGLVRNFGQARREETKGQLGYIINGDKL